MVVRLTLSAPSGYKYCTRAFRVDVASDILIMRPTTLASTPASIRWAADIELAHVQRVSIWVWNPSPTIVVPSMQVSVSCGGKT